MDMVMFGTPDEEGSRISFQGASSSAGAAGRSLKKSSSTNSSGRGKRRSSPSSFVKMMEGNGGCHWLMANEGEEEFGYSDYAVVDREMFALEDDEQEGASAAATAAPRTAVMFQQQQQCQHHQRPPPSKRLKVLTELAACEERLDEEEEEEGRGRGGEKVMGEEQGDGTTALLASVEAEGKEGEGQDDEEMCSLLAAPADPLLIYPPPLDLNAPPRCQTPCCNVSIPSPISCYLDGHLPKAPVAARHTMQHYGPEHFHKMREVELMVYQPDPQYEDQQKEFRPDMRAQLIDWLMEVSANFLVHRRTFQIAVNYIDRFLSIDKNQGYSPNKLQLLGVTSLLVASKVEEIYPPKAKELAITTAGASTAKEILKMEHELMQALSWRLSPPTVDDWAGWYLMKLSEHVATSQLPPTLLRSLHIVLDLSLLDVTSLHFFPSMLAAAALYNALPTHLHPALEAYTGYSIYNNDIKKCQAYLEFLHTTFNEDVSLLPAVSPRCIRARKEVPCWDRHNMQTHHPGLLSHLLERMDALADTFEPPPFITHRSVSGVSNMTGSSDSEGEEEGEEEDYDDDYLMEEEDDEEASLAASSATGELNHYRHVRQQHHREGEEEEGVDSSGSDCESLFQYCGFAGLMDEDREEYDQEETTQLMTMEEPHHHQQQLLRPSSRASDFTCTSSSAMSQGEGDGPLALRDLATEELFWEIAGVVTTREDSVWSASFPTAEEEEVEHEEEEEEGEEEEEYCGKKGERGGKPIAAVQQQRPYHRSKKGAAEEGFYGKEAILSSSCSSSLGTSVTASLASSSSSSSCWSSAAAAAATVTLGAVDRGLSRQQASSTTLTKVL